MKLPVSAFCLVALLTCPATAAPAEAPKGAAPACQIAEVNPVTGAVYCIKPPGAPVEAPKATESEPCKPQTRENADWTWRPKCKG